MCRFCGALGLVEVELPPKPPGLVGVGLTLELCRVRQDGHTRWEGGSKRAHVRREPGTWNCRPHAHELPLIRMSRFVVVAYLACGALGEAAWPLQPPPGYLWITAMTQVVGRAALV